MTAAFTLKGYSAAFYTKGYVATFDLLPANTAALPQITLQDGSTGLTLQDGSTPITTQP